RTTTPRSHARKHRLTERHPHSDYRKNQRERRLLPPQCDRGDDRHDSDPTSHSSRNRSRIPFHRTPRGTPRQHATVQNPYIAQARLTKDPLRGARTHTRTTDEYHRLPGRRKLLHSPSQLSQGNVARTCKMPGGELRRLA